MAKGLTEQQRKFAELYVSGVPAGRAYEQAGYKAKGSKADQSASRLLSSNAKVKAFVKDLREQSSDECRWDRKKAMDFLCDVLETPVGNVGKDNVLAQSHTSATEKTGEKIAMPDKIRAFQELAKMTGWYEPERHQLEFEVTIGGDGENSES